MKKVIYSFAALSIVLTLFSFTPKEKEKATYKEITEVTSTGDVAGKFTRYERDHSTADKGTWNYRNETYSITQESGLLTDIENVLNNNN